jgi:micrococcal nuclease
MLKKVARVTVKHCLFPFVPFLLIALLASIPAESGHKKDGLLANNGQVIAVYDGDTIKVRFTDGSERRIRLIGIDTPEIDEGQEEARLEAQLAKRFAFHYLYQKQVNLTYERDLEDKYGRLLAYVWTEQGLFNEFILKQGFARVFWAFPHELKERFIRAQQEAREKERGFWRKRPYPLVSGQDIRDHIGELRRVRFVCVRMRRRGNFLFLNPEAGNFSVLIPQENLSFFPGWKSWNESTIEAGGFLEEYKGQPQIMVFFPLQLKVLEDEKR